MPPLKVVARTVDPQEALNDAARRYAEVRHHRRAVRLVIYLDDGAKCLWPIADPLLTEYVDPTCRLSDDGRTLVWFGRRFTFTRTQGPIIALLLSAWEEGSRDVAQDVLLRRRKRQQPPGVFISTQLRLGHNPRARRFTRHVSPCRTG